jgi:hypothetical protein
MTEKDRPEQAPAGLSEEELAAADPVELPGREALSVVTLGGPNAAPVPDVAPGGEQGPGQIGFEPGVPSE